MSVLRRLRFRSTPLHAWPTHVRRSIGRTALGTLLKRAPQRQPAPVPVQPQRRPRPGGRNVLLVSHCDFTGSSAYHVHSIARELVPLGWSSAVAVPGSTRGAGELGRADFPIVSYAAVRRGRLRFPDGGAVDLVHAFTPRANVRRLTLELGVPYVVHLEDNEAVVRSALRVPADADAERAFVAGAAGATVVVERLLELVPAELPAQVVWPGYDEELDGPGRPRAAIRRDAGLADDEFAVVYTGNVHEANVDEVRELYLAVERLRREGRKVVLVKSGWNSIPRSRLPRLGRGVRDLGWIRRHRVRELIRAADVLVQPGAPGPFNDYRFPSKLPDYLASGNPIVLPRTNIGIELEDERHALLLQDGGAEEITAAMRRLLADSTLCERLGGAARTFATHSLRWASAAGATERAYATALGRSAD